MNNARSKSKINIVDKIKELYNISFISTESSFEVTREAFNKLTGFLQDKPLDVITPLIKSFTDKGISFSKLREKDLSKLLKLAEHHSELKQCLAYEVDEEIIDSSNNETISNNNNLDSFISKPETEQEPESFIFGKKEKKKIEKELNINFHNEYSQALKNSLAEVKKEEDYSGQLFEEDNNEISDQQLDQPIDYYPIFGGLNDNDNVETTGQSPQDQNQNWTSRYLNYYILL